MLKPPLKTLFLSHDADRSGASHCLMTFLAALDRRKIAPRVVLPRSGNLETSLRQLEIGYDIAPLVWSTGPLADSSLRFANGLNERVAAVETILRTHAIDLVVSNTLVIVEGALAARAMGLPHVWHATEILSADPVLKDGVKLVPYLRALDGLADRFLAVSEAVARDLEAGIPRRKISILHSGAELSAIESRTGENPMILFAGLLSARKNPLALVEAAPMVLARIPTAKFVITGGDGGALSPVKSRIRALGLESAFEVVGHRTDLPDLVAACDLLALTSKSDPLPLVVLMAMAQGKPVVATRSGGVEEMVVDGETGRLAAQSNPAQLANAILETLSHGRAWGEAGRRRLMQNFHLPTQTRLLESMLAEVASGTRSTDNSFAEPILRALIPAETGRGDDLWAEGSSEAMFRLFRDTRPPPPPLISQVNGARPEISVAIPIYQGATYLRAAIESVLAQSATEFELILIDDGSSDDSLNILRSFSDPRIRRFENSTRLGLAGNWNRCLELARGEFITVFHQDDVMAPHNLAFKAAVFRQNPNVGLVYSERSHLENRLSGETEPWQPDSPWTTDRIIPGAEFAERLFLGPNFVCCPSVMLRRSALEELGAFDPALPFTADLEMWLRFALRYDVGFISERLIGYRTHGTNESHRFFNLEGIHQEYLARSTALERDSEKVPGYLHVKASIARRHAEQALWLSRQYYDKREWHRASECLHAAMNLTLPDDFGDSRFLRWQMDRAMKLEPVLKNSAVGTRYLANRRALEIAEYVSLERLIKALVAKGMRFFSPTRP